MKESIDEKNTFIYNVTIKLLLIALIIAFLVVGKPVLLPFAVAMLFSFMLLPISQKLEQWRIPRAIAIVISLIIAVALVAGLIYFFYREVLMFVNDWPALSKQISVKIDAIFQFVHENFNYSEVEQKNFLNERISAAGESAGNVMLGVFTATGTFIASVALIPIFIFFLTYYRGKFKHFIELIFKDERAGHTLDIVKKVSTVSQKYLKGLVIDIVILSILNSIGFMIFGLKHAILFGVLAAILNVIPYIGILIGSILPILMAIITKDQFSAAIGVAGVCVFVQFLDNNFITPNIIGGAVSINPLSAILALTISAMIWGIIGMVVALPFIGMMKVTFDNIEVMKPYGYLIGEERSYSPDNTFARRIFRNRSKASKPDNNNKQT